MAEKRAVMRQMKIIVTFRLASLNVHTIVSPNLRRRLSHPISDDCLTQSRCERLSHPIPDDCLTQSQPEIVSPNLGGGHVAITTNNTLAYCWPNSKERRAPYQITTNATTCNVVEAVYRNSYSRLLVRMLALIYRVAPSTSSLATMVQL